MNKYLYGLLASLLVAVSSGFGADLTAVATIKAVGSTPAGTPSTYANTNLVAGPGFLYSITLSGTGWGAGTNVTSYLYDSENSTYSVSTTYAIISSSRGTTNYTWTDPYGVARSRYVSNVLFSAKSSTTTSLPKTTLALLSYQPNTQTPITYTFDPPLAFSKGLMLTNLLNGPATGSNDITATYIYSPAY